MASQLSPGVNVSEADLTTIVPAVSTSVGAFAGLFRWGPVGEATLIDSETTLVSKFGKPTNHNPETFFTAANFLSYTNALYVARAANTTGTNYNAAFVCNTAGNTVSNNYYFTSNTSGIVSGMYVTQTTNTSVVPANTYVLEVVNSTAVTLSHSVNVSTSTTLYLGNQNTVYSAIGLETGSYCANLVNQIVKNKTDYERTRVFESGVTYVAKYPGELGNSLKVSVCDNANAYSSNVTVGNTSVNGFFTVLSGSNTANVFIVNDPSLTAAANIAGAITIGDQILIGNSSTGTQYLKVVSISSASNNSTSNSNFTIGFSTPSRISSDWVVSGNGSSITRQWEYYNVVGVAPGQSTYQRTNGNTSAHDELHVVVVDEKGKFTGTPGTILETFQGLSRATDARNLDNSTNYYKTIINENSAYVWWANDRSNAVSNTALNLTSSTNIKPGNYQLSLGTDAYGESSIGLAAVASGYDVFSNKEEIDISIVLQGKPTGNTGTSYQLANYIIDNITDVRKDCVVVISPDKSLVLNNFRNEAASIINWKNSVHDSSYAIMDTGYKYQYDRYNDVYRWIPLNGDIGGLLARTDQTNDAWWSPAGFNRGQIKNLVKLAYNPNQTDRDLLYPKNINPVVSFTGQGTVLYGDKTLQSKPSSFDRINVRRLFIVLEKAIAQAAKFSLFEFNDTFTRSQFKNLITPYLRNVQGRRGITDFYVVCDETNNTSQIIDANQFVGDIYIKPAHSINFIQLNFVAVGTNVQFSQVIGQF